MKACYVNHLILYPRIRKEVISSIDCCENLVVEENEITMGTKMQRLQEIIIKLLHTCLEILEKELRSYDLEEDMYSLETVLGGSYVRTLQAELKKDFNELGAKANQMLRDMGSLKVLLSLLLDSDPINFHMRLSEVKETENPYSIFKFWDDETSDLLIEIEDLNLQRIYTIEAKQKDEGDLTKAQKGMLIHTS